MSGYSEQSLRDRGGDGDEVAFIEKPFAPGELTDRIAALLRAAERPGVGETLELD
jgi:DNA-binding response OmpR family regulator